MLVFFLPKDIHVHEMLLADFGLEIIPIKLKVFSSNVLKYMHAFGTSHQCGTVEECDLHLQ